MLSSKEVQQNLSENDIINIMSELGAEVFKRTDNELIFSSICHGDMSKHKLYCYHNEQGYSFHCYICLFNGDIFSLISEVKNCSFKDAFKMVTDICGISTTTSTQKRTFGTIPLLSEDCWKLLNAYKTHNRQAPVLNTYEEKVLGLFTKEYHYSWIKEYISIEAMEKYGIGYYLPQNAITIPHRDINGNLVGIRKRNLDEETVARGYKYMPIKIQGVEYSHPLAFNLFSIYENQETIKKIKKICLFEAEKSVLQLESYYPNHNWGLAMCGSNLSNAQRDLILSLDVEEVVLCKDKDWKDKQDPKYKLFERQYMIIAQKLAPFVNFYVVEKGMETELGLKESPSDRGKEVFEKLLKQKKLITLENVQRYFSREKEEE